MFSLNYMLEKINLLENKDDIITGAEELVESLMNNKALNKSEKLMAIELAMAKLNYILYNISGDKPNENA